MRIVMCIKPVKKELVYKEDDYRENLVINPYDLFALQNIIEMKKEGTEIICISMGPEAAKETLRRCIALGVDEVIHLKDKHFAGADTIATSYVLKKAIKKIGDVDLICCGQKTVDGETGQVVYALSEQLDIPCIAQVETITNLNADNASIERENGEYFEKIRVGLPAVISYRNCTTIYNKINLLRLKRAKNHKVVVWNMSDLQIDRSKCGLKGSKTIVQDVNKINPIIKKEQTILDGDVKDTATILKNIILGKNNGVCTYGK
ncbi:electron transfer flavoprotein subunit beta/FixA family protein [Vallitalea sediminicola]